MHPGSIEPSCYLRCFDLPRRKTPPGEPDRLLDQLDKVERELQKWTSISPENAAWFRRDPLSAMRAAGLDIDDDIMLELELVAKAIAKKLK